MKSLAHIHVWWCGINKDIEQLVRGCALCQSVRNVPLTSYLHPWAWPDGPWKGVHVDFAGPFLESMFMLIVDDHSKWLEVVKNVTVHAKRYHKSAKIFFAFAYDLALLQPSARPCKI